MRLFRLFNAERSAIALATLLSLAACGGGGGGSAATTSTATTASLSGTAAIGQPISGQVVAIDINGRVSPPATTTALGAFVVNVNGMTAPYVLTITGTAGGRQVVLNSIASAAGQTVNITPLTDLIVSTASGAPAGTSLASLCASTNQDLSACTSALSAATNGTRLNDAVAQVSAMIAPLNTSGTNPLTGAFAADGTGLDGVLDKILVSPAVSNGDMATVTLIATNTTIGQVVLSATPGAAPLSITPTPPNNTQVATANAVASVLPEVKACVAAFSALYPKTNFSAPSASQVGDFVDASFRLSVGEDKAAFVAAFSNANLAAVPGFTVEVVGLAPYDMSPLDSAETTTLRTALANSGTTVASLVKARTAGAIAFDSNGAPTSAWVHLRTTGDASPSNWKMVKGSAYAGCPGGWRLAGTQHADMHMNARISRLNNVIHREWAFHIEKSAVQAEETSTPTSLADTVVVKGPGLTTYGNYTASLNTSTAPTGVPLTLILPTGLNAVMRVNDSTNFYVNADAIQSCQDLAQVTGNTLPGTNTPCLDESKVAPGKLYSWVIKNAAGGTIYAAFPFQIQAVPLSAAYATANASDLFANITSVTPATSADVDAAIAGTSGVLDGIFTINYTQSATYGSKADNCGLTLTDGTSVQVLRAEQNAVGHETSCTFNTATLNSGSLARPGVPVAGGFIAVTTTALGNQISTGRNY